MRKKTRIPTQGVIPSQARPARVPYSNREQADVALLKPMQPSHTPEELGGFGINDLIPGISDFNSVLSIWDSRPMNSREFVRTPQIAGILDATSTIFTFSFLNPIGRTLFIRSWEVSAILATTGAPITNADGTSNVLVAFDFLNSGIAYIDYSGFSLNTVPFGPVSGDTFLPVPQNTIFTLRGTITAAAGITFVDGQIELKGTSLLATSDDVNTEQASKSPINVRVVKDDE